MLDLPPATAEFVVSIEPDLDTGERPDGYRLLSGPLPEGGAGS